MSPASLPVAATAAAVGNDRRHGRLSDLIFRLAFAPIFVVGGLGHFFRSDEMLQRIEGSPWVSLVKTIGDPLVLLWLSGAVFVVAGTLLALGALTRLSALALFATLVPITLAIHLAPDHVGPLLKNVAILGGLVHFMVRGPGGYALAPGTGWSRGIAAG